MKDIRVSFCPKCKSRNVKYIFELRNFFGVIPKMKCMDCETQMPNFPVLVVDKLELEKKNLKIKSKAKRK